MQPNQTNTFVDISYWRYVQIGEELKKIYKVCLAFHIKSAQYDESYRHLIPDTETQKFPSNNLNSMS